MLELIRSKIINRIKDRYLAMSKKPGPLYVKIKRILDEHIDECVGYTYIWNGRNGFQVKAHAEQYSVDTTKHQYSCGAWQLSGIPYSHAISCLRHIGKNLSDTLPECYKKTTFLQTHSHILFSMDGPHL
ncbi:hypothetical protein LIER_38978 [Lithospermum erythrorhizon]|uniref:Zinc finger PMZ-type domain-containing protein n=1 Tax=Lithospermum erythrorhizon TaxID=34254 RepID=A0AAV3QAY7_LITER